MTNKELIDAFRSQTKYVTFGKFLENFEIPEEEENEEILDDTSTSE